MGQGWGLETDPWGSPSSVSCTWGLMNHGLTRIFPVCSKTCAHFTFAVHQGLFKLSCDCHHKASGRIILILHVMNGSFRKPHMADTALSCGH